MQYIGYYIRRLRNYPSLKCGYYRCVFSGWCFTHQYKNTTQFYFYAALLSSQNTNQQKRLLSEVFIISASTTVGEVSAAVSKGTILIYHTTVTQMPSYGRGIILYSSDANFKALLADDDNHSVYLWSCHKQRPSTKILDVVNVIKIV